MHTAISNSEVIDAFYAPVTRFVDESRQVKEVDCSFNGDLIGDVPTNHGEVPTIISTITRPYSAKPTVFLHKFDRTVQEQVRLVTEVPVRIEIQFAICDRMGILEDKVVNPLRCTR